MSSDPPIKPKMKCYACEDCGYAWFSSGIKIPCDECGGEPVKNVLFLIRQQSRALHDILEICHNNPDDGVGEEIKRRIEAMEERIKAIQEW